MSVVAPRFSPIGNSGKLCPGCLCRIAGFGHHHHAHAIKLTNCKDCRGWSIPPIPPQELGIITPHYEYKHD